MRIVDDIKLDYSDVLLVPKRSILKSRKDVNLIRGYLTVNSKQSLSGVPIMSANMDGVGTFEMALTLYEENIYTTLKKTYTVNELVEFFETNTVNQVAMSIGTSNNDLDKFMKVQELSDGAVKMLCVDVANGYTEHFNEFIYQLRLNFPSLVIIAGNVVTADQTQELILKGADIVKVGIGPGSVCTTRIKTGVGYPQLSAVIECADAAHGLGGHIIADGGCTCPGDVAKAFAAGADFVMLGGMLAGHDQGGGEIITKYFNPNGEHFFQKENKKGQILETYQPVITNKKYIQFYGMSSKAANDKHFGGLKDYRSSEGREVLVDYKGCVRDTIQDILGGLRSTCTYVGASKLKHLSKCSTFVRTNNQFNKIFT